ncbi:hypothetical protein FOCC_FOCC016351 [Frankliniella occidentalis]|nr:hypothetical protein FOCC_FOCC016351 [Frankliniella occidentalis]
MNPSVLNFSAMSWETFGTKGIIFEREQLNRLKCSQKIGFTSLADSYAQTHRKTEYSIHGLLPIAAIVLTTGKKRSTVRSFCGDPATTTSPLFAVAMI